MTFLIVGIAVHAALIGSGFLPAFYGPDFQVKVKEPLDAAARLDLARKHFWTVALAFPFQVGFTLAFFSKGRRSRLYQLGLDAAHAWRNIKWGFTTWLILTPCVFAINLLVVIGYTMWHRAPPELHPIAQLIHGPVTDRVLMFFAVIVAAPVVEELYFRGILQPW